MLPKVRKLCSKALFANLYFREVWTVLCAPKITSFATLMYVYIGYTYLITAYWYSSVVTESVTNQQSQHLYKYQRTVVFYAKYFYAHSCTGGRVKENKRNLVGHSKTRAMIKCVKKGSYRQPRSSEESGKSLSHQTQHFVMTDCINIFICFPSQNTLNCIHTHS